MSDTTPKPAPETSVEVPLTESEVRRLLNPNFDEWGGEDHELMCRIRNYIAGRLTERAMDSRPRPLVRFNPGGFVNIERPA